MPYKGYRQTKEHREKIKQANIGKQAGEKHPNWKGGVKIKDVKKYRREQMKRLYQNNPDKFRERKRLAYQNNPEKFAERHRKWLRENKEKVRETAKRWRRNNPEKRRFQSSLRAARKRNAEGKFTFGEWELLKKQYSHTCPMCGRKEPKIKLTIDHIIPISKGGSNWIENIQPLCGSCNNRKYTKIIYYSFFAKDN